jgi:ubiquinone/menaquinone biosynthesis C-methylase UbiE
MGVSQKEIEAGQAIYSRRILNVYDVIVHGVSNPLIWKCPTGRLIEHYNQHVSANHLDVGVGTGYLLDKCRFPVPSPRVGLMDLNSNTLDYASKRIARYPTETWQRNILAPIPFDGEKFDSIGLSYLLHCIPGDIESKAVAFDHLTELLNPGGVLFGATLLHEGVERNWFARRLMAFYNKKGVFANREDSLEGLQQAIESRFSDITLDVIGCAALFAVKK